METVAYFQLVQDYENSELPQPNLPSLSHVKAANKMMAAGVTGAALVGGSLVQLPALACGSISSCRPVSWQPVVVRPIVVQPVVVRPSFPVCYQPSCYPQGGHEVGYYPEDNYYPEPDYKEHDYEESDCNCSGNSGGDDYHEIAFHPEDPNFLTLGSSGQLVALLQQTLLDQGFNPGPVDGLFGHQTSAAVADFQAAAGLQVDGIAGGQTLDALGLAGAGA